MQYILKKQAFNLKTRTNVVQIFLMGDHDILQSLRLYIGYHFMNLGLLFYMG